MLDRNLQALTVEKFCSVLIDFEYSVNREELRIDDIFVNHFNDPDLTPKELGFPTEKKESFARAVIDRLKEIGLLSTQ